MLNYEHSQPPIKHTPDVDLPTPDNPTLLDLHQLHDEVKTQFLTFYREQGYIVKPAIPIIPPEDPTVVFTGATITALKGNLATGIEPPGYCMVQNCLRVKRLEQMYDMNSYPEWTHYFTMCGVLASPDRKQDVINEAHTVLTERLHIAPTQLLIFASSLDEDLYGPFAARGIAVQTDTEDMSYYRWKYGIPDTHGRGITFLLRKDSDSIFRELGNIISIETADHHVQGFEFGFGVESFLSSTLGLKKPMEASIVSSVIPYEEGAQEKLLDALTAAIVIYHHNIEPGRGKERHILKKLVKGISFMRRRMGVSVEDIQNMGNAFEKAEFSGQEGSGQKLSTGIMDYEETVEKFIAYAKNQVHAHQLRNEMGPYLKNKLYKEGERLGVSPIEMEAIISSVYP